MDEQAAAQGQVNIQVHTEVSENCIHTVSSEQHACGTWCVPVCMRCVALTQAEPAVSAWSWPLFTSTLSLPVCTDLIKNAPITFLSFFTSLLLLLLFLSLSVSVQLALKLHAQAHHYADPYTS